MLNTLGSLLIYSSLFVLKFISQLPEVIPHKVFVNICGWERMPAPKSDRDPIPVMVGELHTEGDPQFSVIDAVINPIALKGVDNNKDHKNLLAHVALDYIEAVKSIRLSRKYKTLKAKYKGDPKQLRRFLKAPASLSGKKRENAAGTSVPSDPSSLLQQLSTITVSDSNTDVGEPLPNLFQQNTQKPAKPGLIQEISSTPNEEMPPVPKHELHIRDADGTKPQRILLHVCLPGVTSAASCQLDISEVKLTSTFKWQLGKRLMSEERQFSQTPTV